MRFNSFIVALAVVIGVGALSQTASAYYHPGMGRFLSRDPIGDITPPRSTPIALPVGAGFIPRDQIGTSGHSMDVWQQAENAARASTHRILGNTPAASRHVWKHADSMDLYLYVKGNPVSNRDPSGLFTYGNYCGAGSPAIVNPPAPAPVDEIDWACYWHDACYGAAGAAGFTRPESKCGVRNCDRKLYNAMHDVINDTSGKYDQTQQLAAREIAGFFRGSCGPPTGNAECPPCKPPSVNCNK